MIGAAGNPSIARCNTGDELVGSGFAGGVSSVVPNAATEQVEALASASAPVIAIAVCLPVPATVGIPTAP